MCYASFFYHCQRGQVTKKNGEISSQIVGASLLVKNDRSLNLTAVKNKMNKMKKEPNWKMIGVLHSQKKML